MENALYAAAAGGHETVVRLLVTIGADVNGQGGEYGAGYKRSGGENGNALRAASPGCHEKVVPAVTRKGCRYQTLRIQFT
jgi:hypothetical protein